MLQASKANLVTHFTSKSLEIRQHELNYWLNVFKKFAILSAFLGGFASTVLLKGHKLDASESFSLIYILATTGALGFNLVLLTISIMCSLWAPGKALTGQGQDAYQIVIELMERMYGVSILLFKGGLFLYLITTLMFSMCLFKFTSFLIILATGMVFAYFIFRHSLSLIRKFSVDSFISGALRGNRINNIGEELSSSKDPTLKGSTFNLEFSNFI